MSEFAPGVALHIITSRERDLSQPAKAILSFEICLHWLRIFVKLSAQVQRAISSFPTDRIAPGVALHMFSRRERDLCQPAKAISSFENRLIAPEAANKVFCFPFVFIGFAHSSEF
jgi:hypothetical protein